MIELLFVLFSGLVFGSFVTLACYRLPREEDIVVKPSRCPQCDSKLSFKDLWPVLSWLISKGNCRYCKASIPVRYPVIELITLLLFLLIYITHGFNLPAIILALMAVALLIMIIVDLEHYLIPDEVHYALLPLGLGYHAALGTPWEEVAGGFALGMGIGLTLHYGYRILRHKDGLGFGDVKFLAIAGLWLGIKPMVPFIFYSGLLGIMTGLLWRLLKKGPIFPFGPALAMSFFLCVVFPEFANLFYNIENIIKQHI